ncbi:hypothetical protein QWI29_24610 [Mycolicibacterium neoaurum]|uniref:hypothetical protein n=1 Tax=Mycolicibacterium neoaurum TaxID=1795 RepID=UPI0026717BC3|nr:hypothetical protein [Mycolicibacterium neoaurum]MDO3403237.1 hypothetical protein [Mycolicibacterium neoaurum]
MGTDQSYVLLAPGGAGKTTLIEALQAEELFSTSIDLRLHSRRSVAELVDLIPTSASPAGGTQPTTVFVDSIDEALQIDSNIGYMLVKLASHPRLAHVAWRFACRPSSWTVDLASGMRTALSGFEELELLPLSLLDLQGLAQGDAEDFLRDAQLAGLTRLLALPLHAVNLLDDWRTRGRMPSNRSEAMQHAITRLLTETSSTRPAEVLDRQRRQLVAERLAATSIFCNVRSYAPKTPTNEQDSSIAVSSLPTQEEPDLAGSPLTPGHFREVLGTGLFAAAGHGTVTFAHQSYTEFLAAQYLIRRGVSGQRLVSLLGADINGIAPGPMIEVLGWLLALHATVPDKLIASNAEQLLGTTGLELVDDQVRKRIVEALLAAAANGTIGYGWRSETTVLAHPELASQLHKAAQEASNPSVAYWICRIARQCGAAEATDDLFEVAFNSSWPDVVRAEAVKAFAAVAPPNRLSQLAPLLDLGADEDPLDEILAATLRALLPDAVESDHIRRALRPQRVSNHIGAYRIILSELPTLLPDSDVASTFTDALSRRPQQSDHAFDDLLTGLLRRAWEIRDSAVAEALGRALGSDRLGFPPSLRREGLPWDADDDPELRRIMAVAAFTAHEDAFAAVYDLRMLTASDLVWLVDWIGDAAPPEALEASRIVLRHLAWYPADAAAADCILELGEDHPAYAAISDFQGSDDIDTRPDWVAREIEYARSLPTEAESVSDVREALTEAQADISRWWHLVAALTDPARPDADQLLEWDLTSRALWPALSVAEQEEILRLGLNYVRWRHPSVSSWESRQTLTLDIAMPDWAAVFLLATLAVRRPSLLADVELTTWVTWAPAITAMPPYLKGGSWQRETRDAAPQAGREAIDTAFRERLQEAADATLDYHPLADFTDQGHIAIIEGIALSADLPANRRSSALTTLAEHAPMRALVIARAALNDDTPPPAVLTTLARLAPEELLARWFAEDRPMELEYLRDVNIDYLSNDSVSALTARLLDQFPMANDPDDLAIVGSSTPESTARWVRTSLLQAMAGRGMVASLDALGRGLPPRDSDYIQLLLREARIHEASASWNPLQPATLFKLVASGDARLIRDTASLQALLIEKIGEIQDDAHRRAAFRSVWDGEPGKEGASPKSEDTVSDWLAEQLRLRLQPHVVLDREIQITRHKEAGIGTRIDITATAGGIRLARVVFEAKHVNNAGLTTAIDDQLIDRYMSPGAFDYGIYIVYWTAPELRPPSWTRKHRDAEVLAKNLRVQAERHLPHKHIEVILFDIGPAI